MRRSIALLPLLLLAACATAAEDDDYALDSGVTIGKKDSGAPDTFVPEIDTGTAPDTSVADTTLPDTSVADTSVADTAVVDTNSPDTYVPDTAVADTNSPDTYVPDTAVADTSVADTATGDGGACSGTIVDWNWNTGSGPTGPALTTSSATSLWAVGAATAGPKDSLNWLATNPGGNYVNNMSEWVQLPTIDLSAHATCRIKITVDLWRSSEGSVANRDGGNLQYNVVPSATTGWKVIDGGSMGYDGTLSTLGCSSGCALYNQQTWSSTYTPYAKTGVFTSTAPMGASLALRFTFYSDSSLASYAGLYIKSLRVEALP